MSNTAPRLIIGDRVQIMQTPEHEASGHANKLGVVVSFTNERDGDGLFQLCEIDCGSEIVSKISSRCLMRVRE